MLTGKHSESADLKSRCGLQYNRPSVFFFFESFAILDVVLPVSGAGYS